MAIYDGIPLNTLSEALTLAQAALPPLLRGEAVGALATGDKRIQFVPTSAALLEQHIRDLQAAIGALTGNGFVRKGFYLGENKSL